MKWWEYLLIGLGAMVAFVVVILLREAKPHTQEWVQKALREFPQLLPEYHEKVEDGKLIQGWKIGGGLYWIPDDPPNPRDDPAAQFVSPLLVAGKQIVDSEHPENIGSFGILPHFVELG